MTGQSAELSVFSNMIEDKMILFEKKVRNRKDIIKKAGQLLIDNICPGRIYKGCHGKRKSRVY